VQALPVALELLSSYSGGVAQSMLLSSLYQATQKEGRCSLEFHTHDTVDGEAVRARSKFDTALIPHCQELLTF
jgi:hypothetical protein